MSLVLVDFLDSCGFPRFLWISWILVDFLVSCGFPVFLWISWILVDFLASNFIVTVCLGFRRVKNSLFLSVEYKQGTP